MKLFLAITLLASAAWTPQDVEDPRVAAHSASEAPAAEPVAYDGSAGATAVVTPRFVDADVQIDGLIQEPAWTRAALLRGFTQYRPSEGAPASQRTEVLVFAGADALYFAIRAYDDSPDRIRATLAQRDKIQETDDYVRLILDTFNDQRRAYVLTVNPLGVQHDGLWIEGKQNEHGGGFGDPIDDNPDFLWDSHGRLEEWGYAVEIRVPFKSLRFRRTPVQQWGIQVVRNIRRDGFNESWAPITANRSNKLSQAGELLDLRDLDPGLFLEINPEVTGRRVGEEDDEGVFQRQGAEGDLGLNLTYGVTPNLRFDATYNPDFSQVEADAGQIAVNERFALFFPEKRPFFLEGTEIFNLPQQLVYTRTIADPLGGAKLTGKVGGFDLGYLGALDRMPEEDGPDAFVNFVRARRDVGASSNVGLIYTDRTQSRDLYNRVAGADARIVFGGRYTAQMLASGSVTGDSPGSSLQGGLYSATLERTGRNLSFESGLEGSSPDYRAESGFLRRIGDTEVKGQVRYNLWGSPGAVIQRYGPSVEFNGFWDHDAFWGGQGMKEGKLQLRWSTSLRGNFSFWLTASRELYDFTADKYSGLFLGTSGQGSDAPFYPDQAAFRALNGVRAFLHVGGWGPLQGRITSDWKQTPIFDRELGVPVEPANMWRGEVELSLRPTRSLAVTLNLNHQILNRESDGSRYSTATIPRIRLQYQFSRAWYVRTIAEYASQQQATLTDPETGQILYYCDDDGCTAQDATSDNGLYGDFLLGYEPSPGTVFYMGYTRRMRDMNRFEFRGLEPVADGLFVKFSYRFRF